MYIHVMWKKEGKITKIAKANAGTEDENKLKAKIHQYLHVTVILCKVMCKRVCVC